MSDAKSDDIKGRSKEAAGAVSDDEQLKREGRNDQRAADVKRGVDKVGNKAKEVIDKVRDRSR